MTAADVFFLHTYMSLCEHSVNDLKTYMRDKTPQPNEPAELMVHYHMSSQSIRLQFSSDLQVIYAKAKFVCVLKYLQEEINHFTAEACQSHPLLKT